MVKSGHLHSNWSMYLMLLNVGTKCEVCRYDRNWDLILTIVWRKLIWLHNDVISLFNLYGIQMQIYQGHIRDIPNFIFVNIGLKRAEIYRSEVNREIWRTNVYDIASKSVHPFGWNSIHLAETKHNTTFVTICNNF